MVDKNFSKNKKGFTLIELLIVIAILAVLATSVVIILNPAQLVRQGRDSTRLSDLAALHSALALYLSEVTLENADLGGCAALNARCTANGDTSPFLTRSTCTEASSTVVTGTGWVDVNFNQISSKSPLSKLPLDPVNTENYFYAYACEETNMTYEINANMESTKYASGGDVDVESKDGGDAAGWYEIGNSPGFAL